MRDFLTDDGREAAAWLRQVLVSGGLGGTPAEDERLHDLLAALADAEARAETLARQVAAVEALADAWDEVEEPWEPGRGEARQLRDALRAALADPDGGGA